MVGKPQSRRFDTKEGIRKAVAHLSADKQLRNAMVCTLIGHSRVVYDTGIELRADKGPGQVFEKMHNCSRCMARVEFTDDMIVVGSPKNMANRAKYAAMTWRDKMYSTTPFPNPR